MTGLPEARLAREAELCYAMLALVTDYDVWHEEEEPVTVQMVVERLHRNAAAAQATLRALIPRLAALGGCACGSRPAYAIITDPALPVCRPKRESGWGCCWGSIWGRGRADGLHPRLAFARRPLSPLEERGGGVATLPVPVSPSLFRGGSSSADGGEGHPTPLFRNTYARAAALCSAAALVDPAIVVG